MCPHSISVSLCILLGFQACTADSVWPLPMLDSYIDMSKQQMMVPRHLAGSGVKQILKQALDDARLTHTPTTVSARPGSQAQSQGSPCVMEGLSKHPSALGKGTCRFTFTLWGRCRAFVHRDLPGHCHRCPGQWETKGLSLQNPICEKMVPAVCVVTIC